MNITETMAVLSESIRLTLELSDQAEEVPKANHDLIHALHKLHDDLYDVRVSMEHGFEADIASIRRKAREEAREEIQAFHFKRIESVPHRFTTDKQKDLLKTKWRTGLDGVFTP